LVNCVGTSQHANEIASGKQGCLLDRGRRRLRDGMLRKINATIDAESHDLPPLLTRQ
jgi:hypothetical protein